MFELRLCGKLVMMDAGRTHQEAHFPCLYDKKGQWLCHLAVGGNFLQQPTNCL